MFGQSELIISKLDDLKLIKILNSTRLIGENNDNSLSVRIYQIDNGSGSARIPEGHEVSYNLLIAVSEFDEYPNQNLFEIGPFLSPKFIQWSDNMEYQKEFQIDYGPYNKKRSVILTVNINELIIK